MAPENFYLEPEFVLCLSLIHGFLSPYLQQQQQQKTPTLFLVLSTPGGGIPPLSHPSSRRDA
jgi:hypothetical protein